MKYPLRAVLFTVFAGVAVNAHALCIKSDGSLDDASVSKETIAVDMLPACNDRGLGAAGTTKAKAEVAKQQEQAPAKPAEVAKSGGKRVSLKRDCQTANGESLIGYIGAAELLPVCTL